MRSRIPRVHRALLLAALAVPAVVACQISQKDGTWSFTPVSGPPDVAPTGQFTDPDTGKKYELWDTDGDSKADYIRGEDGKTYRVEPVLPKSLVFGGPHAGMPTPAGARAWFDLYLNPPDAPMPVTFEKTAAESLEQHGLDAVVPGQFALLTSGLVVNDVDPDALDVDLTLAWTAGLGFPDIVEFPSLAYEFYELSDDPGDFGQFLSLRVVGPFLDVAGWLSGFGVEDVEFDTDAGHFELHVDAGQGTALVLLAGQVLYDGPLG